MRFPGAMAIAALTVSRLAFAADPFAGTWKQNIDKSFNSNPRSAVIRIEPAGVNRVKITQDVIRTAAGEAAGKKEQSVGEFTPYSGPRNSDQAIS